MSTTRWVDHVHWKRAYELSSQTGAVDLPGTSWQDRPTVLRTGALAVASDQSAAPGLLAEVAHNAARCAVAAFNETAITLDSSPRARRHHGAGADRRDRQRH